MTGSRRHDILGKKENNLSNIRALYRFENREELMHAEADQIVVTTTELLDVIWNHRSEKLILSNYVESFGNQPKLAKKYGLFVNLNQIYN